MYTARTAQERSLAEESTLFDGKYTILAKLREGGMGTVYKVHHNLLDEIRVIKFMRAAVTGNPDLHRRFLQEAKLVTRFKHPNIAAVYDFAMDDDDTAYIVMEFVDGLNLFDAVQALHPLSVPFVLEITAQTLSALGYLHRKNVVHRDISPDNIMTVVEDGALAVKLIDLGIAKALDATDGVTKTGFFLGKLKYASPEQLGALDGEERLDGRSDLYSMGVVLYELLTGRLPFAGASAQALIAGHLCEPPAPFEASDSEGRVPEPVRNLVMKALAKKREERFSSAEEMRAAISEIARGLPAEALAVDIQRLRDLHAAEQSRALQPVTPSAQQRMNRRFDAVGATPAPPRVSIASDETLPRTVDAPRQKTRPAWNERAGDPTRISHPGVDATVAVGTSRRPRSWMLPAAASGIVALAMVLLLRDRDPVESKSVAATTTSATNTIAPPVATSTEALVTAPRETASDPLLTDTARADAALRLAAEEARTLSATARSRAVATKADALPVFRSGASALRDGEALAAKGSFGPAIAKFTEAARLFGAAEAAARSARTAEPAARRASAEPPPPQVDIPPVRLPSRTEPVAETPADRADVVVPPRETSVPVAEERPAERSAAPSAEDGVRTALAEFTAAQEALDASRYVAIFPSADRARITAAFRSFRSQELDVTINDIDVQGDRATVRAREERVAVPKVGTVQRVTASRIFRLERMGGRWVVTAIQ